MLFRSHGQPVFKSSAEKFEGGGLPFPVLYGMEASLDLISQLGTQTIEDRVLQLASRAREMMRTLGAEAIDNGSQIASARFSRADPSGLARGLKARRVIVAARHGYLRVSPHFYNNQEDLDTFARELKQVLS